MMDQISSQNSNLFQSMLENNLTREEIQLSTFLVLIAVDHDTFKC